MTAAGLVTRLRDDQDSLPMLWYSAGPPCLGVALPVFLDGELPLALSSTEAGSVWAQSREVLRRLRIDPERWTLLRELNAPLQARLDHEANEFAGEGAQWKARGQTEELRRYAGLFLEHVLELWDHRTRRFLEAVDEPISVAH
jgi:hypothetical protein